MTVHDLSLPAKQVRIDTFNFRSMLVLVIPQLKLFGFFYEHNFILVNAYNFTIAFTS